MTEETLIRVVGPRGTDEVNHAGVRYPIAPDGGFYVVAEAVPPLQKTGGFIVRPRTQTEIVVDIARLVDTLKPGRIREIFRRAIIDIFPDAPTEDRGPNVEVADATHVAPMLHRLAIPNPVATLPGRDG